MDKRSVGLNGHQSIIQPCGGPMYLKEGVRIKTFGGSITLGDNLTSHICKNV